MPSLANATYAENKKDLDQLSVIHAEVAGKGPGRKHGVDVLNRTAIVFITACWESFIEDLASEAFDAMLGSVKTPTSIPSKVRNFATKPIFDQKDSTKVWDLADAGWRNLLKAHRDDTLVHWLGPFHTPMSHQVDELYSALLGIPRVSDAWHWNAMSAANARKKLDMYVKIRGNIAHRTVHEEKVYKDWGADYLWHIGMLVEKTEQAVSVHVKSLTGLAPW